MMHGFSIPLLLVLGLEGAWGAILLLPPPLNSPGIMLARATYTPYVSCLA